MRRGKCTNRLSMQLGKSNPLIRRLRKRCGLFAHLCIILRRWLPILGGMRNSMGGSGLLFVHLLVLLQLLCCRQERDYHDMIRRILG